EALASGIVQDSVERIVVESTALTPLVLRKDFRFGWCEHAVEAAQHSHGQHDALILWRTIGATQQVGNLPDEVGEIVMVGHRLPHPVWLQHAPGPARDWLRCRAENGLSATPPPRWSDSLRGLPAGGVGRWHQE